MAASQYRVSSGGDNSVLKSIAVRASPSPVNLIKTIEGRALKWRD